MVPSTKIRGEGNLATTAIWTLMKKECLYIKPNTKG